jgi:hypothetical protein
MDGRGQVNVLVADIGQEVREAKVEPLPRPKREERRALSERRERQVPQMRRRREKAPA